MRLLFSLLFLSSCAVTPRITIDRAKDCETFYGVGGFGLKEVMPKYKVHVMDDKIGDICRDEWGDPIPACTDGYNIYVEYDHFSTTNHELCHIIYKKSWHIGYTKNHVSIDFKDL